MFKKKPLCGFVSCTKTLILPVLYIFMTYNRQMKKNISIVTWLGYGNYGTSLQSFSLHQKLKDLGYNVNILSEYSYTGNLSFSMRLSNLLRQIKFNTRWYYLQSPKLRKLHKFQKEKYNRKFILTGRQFENLLNRTDVFVTGSDQIWNTEHQYSPFMFLDFARNVKRVAYASSIGTNNIPEKYKEKVKNHLEKFSHIGVRENTAVGILSALLKRNDICQVADPTFLLTADDWDRVSQEASFEKKMPSDYILCYFIGNRPEYAEYLNNIRHKYGIDNVLLIPSKETPNIRLDNVVTYDYAGPREFVRLIKDSSLVCTDSFHAIALSMNLSKDFVVFKRFADSDSSSQNSRIYDLLNEFGLSSRMYTNDVYERLDDIRYKEIQKAIDEKRKESLKFLINAIEH